MTPFRIALIAAAALAIGLLIGRESKGQELGETCLNKVSNIASRLGDSHSERMQILLQAEGRIYVVMIAPHGGTWTLLRVTTPGCVVTAIAGDEHIALPMIGEGL